MKCPKCGRELQMDPDGGWCGFCGEYFPMDILDEWLEENE